MVSFLGSGEWLMPQNTPVSQTGYCLEIGRCGSNGIGVRTYGSQNLTALGSRALVMRPGWPANNTAHMDLMPKMIAVCQTVWAYIWNWAPRWSTVACLRNDLYCVEWDVKLYYTIPYQWLVQRQHQYADDTQI